VVFGFSAIRTAGRFLVRLVSDGSFTGRKDGISARLRESHRMKRLPLCSRVRVHRVLLPADPTEEELARDFSLSGADKTEIKRCGFARLRPIGRVRRGRAWGVHLRNVGAGRLGRFVGDGRQSWRRMNP
jgi:hypothetical protein